MTSFSLIAPVPRPRVNLTRYHGVFAPNSKYRASMTLARRLKPVFNIDIDTCGKCGGDVRIIACIEDPTVIAKILTHLNDKVVSTGRALVPACRAPPPTELLV